MVLMIIKGIFRRYEKWNPVHPTYGAFWGMGIGIGCGVGWGPGFGPEVIGYVGAGCGVGFSVGITLAGLGIGLPTNLLLAAPYNTVEATRKGAFKLFGKNLSMDGWSDFVPQIAGLQRQVNEMCSGFNQKPQLDNAIDIKSFPLFISHECGRFGSHLLLHMHKVAEIHIREYKQWSVAKQSESSSTHGYLSTDGDSSPPRSSSRGRPKANRVETSAELPDHKIHGFINEYLFLKNFLLKQKESEVFKALAIVGKYGVGKTTLCQDVFNNKDVKDAYFPRIWVSMYSKETQEDEDPKIAVVKRILLSLGVEEEMLNHIQTDAEEEKRMKVEAGEREEETVTENELSLLLYALHMNLIGKKYLIVLDDVWEDNEWNQRLDDDKNQQEKTHLSCGFPKGCGGRVIVTSRDESLAKEIVGEEENLQRLFPRHDAESVWEIYKDAATALEIDVNPRYPVRFKQELMDKSCGIPLAARMLAKIEPAKTDEYEGDIDRKKSF